uniref:Uncharacterized protein n=1 Tax=Trichobilharzia regenti TaxID=157069 RepID=A0AA85JH49_TRIRE|nr:unnamed protein product [Trichobilharzia regenti]
MQSSSEMGKEMNSSPEPDADNGQQLFPGAYISPIPTTRKGFTKNNPLTPNQPKHSTPDEGDRRPDHTVISNSRSEESLESQNATTRIRNTTYIICRTHERDQPSLQMDKTNDTSIDVPEKMELNKTYVIKRSQD